MHGFASDEYVMRGLANGLVSAFGQSTDGDFVVIGAGTGNVYQGKTAADVEVYKNVKAYESAADVTATSCGSATSFATADNKFVISWNGKSIYEETVAAA